MELQQEWTLPAAELDLLSSNTIADVLDGLGIWGALSPRVRQVAGRRKAVFGRAYTVQWRPARKASDIRSATSTWDEVKAFLAPDVTDARGRVYVAGGGPIIDHMALAGGLSATHFENVGFEGLILGGAIRDARVLERRRVPIFASNFVALDTAGAYVVSEVGTRCIIDNVLVETGDYIFADESGVLCIPETCARDVIVEAVAIAREEAALMMKLEKHESLPAILAAGGRI